MLSVGTGARFLLSTAFAEDVSYKLLCLSAFRDGEQALRSQFRADQEDPESRHSQSSVTRRVHAVKREWEAQGTYNEITASILGSLQGVYKEDFIRKDFLGKNDGESGDERAVLRSRSPEPSRRESTTSSSLRGRPLLFGQATRALQAVLTDLLPDSGARQR